MPTIEISKKDFLELLGKKLSIQQLNELFEFTKLELAKEEQDKLTIEIKDTNRLDLLSVEGIVRELRGLLEKESGLKEYKIEKSDYVVKVERKVKAVRPFTVCAVVKDLKFTQEFIEQIVQLQEKLCEGVGKKRKEAALGVYDFDKIKWPVTYTTFKPEALSFVPLGFAEKLNLKQILERHEKGQAYKHLLQEAKEYPIFIDSTSNVLSMPPIINSEYSGKVTQETKNVFIEVSGFDLDKLQYVLNIFVAALADRGGKIYQVNIHDQTRLLTPKFFSRVKKLDIREVNNLLGIELKEKQIIDCLKKARYDIKKSKEELVVDIPFYRQDVLHQVDLIEDIATVYGYKDIEPQSLEIATDGQILEENNFYEEIANLLVGLGFQEILTLNLARKTDVFEQMNLAKQEGVGIKNPISEKDCLRAWLLPSALNFLSQNTTRVMPQKIFEIGKSFHVSEKAETRVKERDKLVLAIAHAKANFTEVKQALEYLLNAFNKKYALKPANHDSFIQGRVADVILGDKKLGFIGEISPKVLENFKLKVPVACFEIELELLR